MTSRLGARLREMMRGESRQPSPPSSLDASGEEGESNPRILIDAIIEDGTPQTVGRCLADAAARALGGIVHDTAAGPCVIVERTYDDQHLHGLLRIGDCASDVRHDAPGLPILAGASWGDDGAAGEPETMRTGAPDALSARGDILFLDLETTGLAGGAGTYAFLVGCGWFQPGGFRVRQYFMVGHALERAMLAGVRERLESCGPLVTYNGKTFDLPVLETRFIFNRQRTPLADRPHLDMLHPARRLWRGARPLVNVPGAQRESCTLSALEHALLGVQRTGDVPGFEIPTRYFAFLRSGDASPLEPVLEHNRLDVVSLAALTARACRLLGEEQPAVDGPRECLGIASLLGRVAAWDRAEACYRRAIDLAARSWQAEDEQVRLEALHALALRCRRTGRYLDAAAHWETITRAWRCPPALMREALEALAIHHEHRSRDLERARQFAEQTRRVAGAHERLDQRLARLDRKITRGGGPPPVPRSACLWG
jgi:uncharacterized protein YprB with RNaseH-like and TPR domain